MNDAAFLRLLGKRFFVSVQVSRREFPPINPYSFERSYHCPAAQRRLLPVKGLFKFVLLIFPMFCEARLKQVSPQGVEQKKKLVALSQPMHKCILLIYLCALLIPVDLWYLEVQYGGDSLFVFASG